MASIVELGPDDCLLVHVGRDLDEHEADALVAVKELLGIRAVIVLPLEVALSSLPADEVLRAVAGA